ncbi:DcaP family trimeric outer membrane transporter [Aequorivita sp. SDUM287046]|uniref:DcaP family trimeric outer membrane transporter n=1 Tax=Aequorivita aurantiaca TaxID=3053356 RepID=A0ABT8DKA0_9FLAO|nr:DcaP family trimeric outer membrane transporter [Aequorivita aurantiaca]MDN3723560.1 DcaP family trimeric outer membrane transporter [Aequorivita aurantiaca]
MKINTLFLIICLLAGTTIFSQEEQAPQISELPAGWWQIPKTPVIFTFGGYVKTDLIHDFDAIDSPDFFDVSKIPTDGSKGESTHFNVKETRLKLDVKYPERGLRAYIEGDFYGSGSSLRIRHAYVEYKGLLAGQTWSNFMDENIIPATLDFEKPAAYAFARQGMLRYKHAISDDMYFGVALEESKATGQAPVQAGKFENPLPDLTGRFRVTKNWGHIQISGFLASIRYRYDAGNKDDITLYGGNLSGQFNFLKKDKIIYQVVYGPGIGRYRGGQSVALDQNGNLEPLTDLGLTFGIEHFWTDKLSSLLVYNYGKVENTAGQPTSALESTDYFAANLIYYVMNGTFIGVEYLRGNREDYNGADGTANRLQLSVRYSFNM